MEKYVYNDVLKMLEIDPFCMEEGLIYANKNRITGIRIKPLNRFTDYGFENANELYNIQLDTSCFKHYNFIKELILEDYININENGLNGLYELNNLIYLNFKNKYMKIDFSHFTKLERLYFKYNNGINGIETLEKLTDILIETLNNSDCKILENLLSLESLCFINGNFVSLNGIENLCNLKKLKITYNSKIMDINFLPNIKELHIEKCKLINDLTFLEDNNSIEELFIDNINTISFVPSMKKLREINFWNCKDGDMTPLIKSKTLEQINFYPNKKHYTHTIENIIKATGTKRGRNV
jgi:internalin A